MFDGLINFALDHLKTIESTTNILSGLFGIILGIAAVWAWMRTRYRLTKSEVIGLRAERDDLHRENGALRQRLSAAEADAAKARRLLPSGVVERSDAERRDRNFALSVSLIKEFFHIEGANLSRLAGELGDWYTALSDDFDAQDQLNLATGYYDVAKFLDPSNRHWHLASTELKLAESFAARDGHALADLMKVDDAEFSRVDDINVARNLATLLMRKARVARDSSLYHFAALFARRAYQVLERFASSKDKNLLMIQMMWGRCLDDLGYYQEALLMAQTCRDNLRQSIGDFSKEAIDASILVGRIFWHMDDSENSISILRKSIEYAKRHLPKNDPVTANALKEIGFSYDHAENYDSACQSLLESREIFQHINNEVAVALCDHTIATTYLKRGKYKQAEELLEKNINAKTILLGEVHFCTGVSINDLGLLYFWTGRYSDAISMFEKTIKIYETVLSRRHPETSVTMQNCANAYREKGLYREAEKLSREALGIKIETFGPLHVKTAASHTSLGWLCYAQERLDEAEEQFLRSKSICEGRLRTEYANAIDGLAHVAQRKAQYDVAETFYKKSLAIREEALGTEHKDIAVAMAHLASVYVDQGRYHAAEPLFIRALKLYEKVFLDDNVIICETLHNLASLYVAEGRFREAEPLHKRALTIRQTVLGEKHPATAASFHELGVLYQHLGRYKDASALHRQALAVREEILGQDHPFTASSLCDFAFALLEEGNSEAAVSLADRSLAIRELRYGEGHPDVASSLMVVGNIALARGRNADAEACFKRAFDIRRKRLEKGHPLTIATLNELADFYYNESRYVVSMEIYGEVLALQERVAGPSSTETAKALRNVAKVYQTQGREEEANQLLERAITIHERVSVLAERTIG